MSVTQKDDEALSGAKSWARIGSRLERIEGKNEYPAEIAIEPELIVRKSTAKALVSC